MQLNISSTISKLDWSGWVLGIWGAVISGGTGAVTAAFGNMILDPKDWNIGSGLRLTLKEMGLCFMISALISLLKYLQVHPIPDGAKNG